MGVQSRREITSGCGNHGGADITFEVQEGFGQRIWGKDISVKGTNVIKGENKDAHYLHHTVDSVVVGRIINSALCT